MFGILSSYSRIDELLKESGCSDKNLESMVQVPSHPCLHVSKEREMFLRGSLCR